MLNSVQLLGHATRDGEIKAFDGGNSVGNFGLATSKSWIGKDGSRQEQTQFHTIICWGKLAEKVEKVGKGDLVLVQGEVEYRNYENKEGVKVYITEIKASYFRFVKKKLTEGVEAATVEDDDLPF